MGEQLGHHTLVRVVMSFGLQSPVREGDVGYVVGDGTGVFSERLVRVIILRTGREYWILRSRLERVDA
jgi:hypothetical protein